ncbi:DUF2207 domain-containing protein [Patescibacteria group bacterium]|nr:DUF2207 domain-containing protein [Patescibacteria group bacterium]
MKKTILKSLIFISAVGLFFLWPSIGQAKSWEITSWDSQIRVKEDGSFSVRETRTFDFEGSFSWVETEVYKDRVDDIVDFKVYDELNQELFSPDVVITDGYSSVHALLNISATDEQKTWIFEYKVLGGIGFFEEHDELYWNVLAQDRDVRVDLVTATVYLPREVRNLSEYAQTIYLGPSGSTEQSDNYEFTNNRTIGFWGQSIEAYEGFTIVASWPKKIIEDPGTIRIEATVDSKSFEGAKIIIDGEETAYTTPYAFQIGDPSNTEETYNFLVQKFGYETEAQEITIRKGETSVYVFNMIETWWHKAWAIILGVLSVVVWLLPFFAFYKYYHRWKIYGQDPKQRGTVVAQYEPYKDIRPSEMGAMMDERVQLKDITPMIVDFAVRGFLIIKEVKRAIRKKDFKLVRTNKCPSGFSECERLMFDGLFGSKQEVKLSSLKNKFYKKIPDITDSLYQAIVKKGYYQESPKDVRKRYIALPIVIFGVAVILTVFLTPISPQVGLLFPPFIFIGIIGIMFSIIMPKATVIGAEAKWWTKGFKLYLSKAERFRLERMTPETFEKYLPYAIVLGVEKKWASRFKDIYKEQPQWYQSATPMRTFALASFTRQLSSFNTNMGGSISSSPKSAGGSSTSGFSGGFSGGGGGGGSVSAG